MILAAGPASPFILPDAVMDAVQIVLLVLVAVLATMVVLTRAPVRQVIVLSSYGLVLALLFLAVQAPDVTLSELTVGAVILPVLLMLALAKVRDQDSGRPPAPERERDP
jgi:energy-converting hydrogenase B subunit D